MSEGTEGTEGTIKGRIANVLGIENNDYWHISDDDVSNDLYLVHYAETADMDKYGHLRGVVVDLQDNIVVCPSLGYSPIVITDELEMTVNSTVDVRDEFGIVYSTASDKVGFKMGFEGVFVRAFHYRGKTYHSSYRRLDISRSRWGHSITFEEMYQKLGVPDSQLFGDGKPSYCYMFILVHPDVLNVSKQDVGPGFAVYMGASRIGPDTGAISQPVSFDLVKDLPGRVTKSVIFSPPFMKMERANKHLMYGFYEHHDPKDKRLGTGEFLMMYIYNEDGSIHRTLRVQSTAYTWRLDTKGSQPNTYRRLYQLLNATYINTNKEYNRIQFRRGYPEMEEFDVDTIVQSVMDSPIVIWPGSDIPLSFPRTWNSKFYNVWVSLLMSVPLHVQKHVVRYFTRLISDRKSLTSWIQGIEGHTNFDDVNRRVKSIISEARRSARRERSKTRSFPERVRSKIRDLVIREEGTSLYGLVFEMRRHNCTLLDKGGST